jgi:hypothetical protein
MSKDTKGNHIEPNEDSLYKVKSLDFKVMRVQVPPLVPFIIKEKK